MSWEIIEGLLKIVAGLATLFACVWKLSSVLTNLNDTINALGTNFVEFKHDSKEAHSEYEDMLGDHENRIIVLETTTGIKHKGEK